MQASITRLEHTERIETRDEPAILALWALRILKYYGANSRLLKNVGSTLDGTRRLLVAEGADLPKTVADLNRLIEVRHREAEAEGATLPETVVRNLRLLRERVPLTLVEELVLVTRTMFRLSELWEDSLCAVAGAFVSDYRIARILGAALRLPPSAVAHALRPDGALRTVGLVELDARLGPFELRLTPLQGLPNALVRDNASADELFAFAAKRASPANLSLAAFPHLQDEIALICDFLRGAGASALRGVNVLLHGAPGTGKTELVRALAHELGCALYEVAAEQASGEEGADGPGTRFRRYRFLQQLLSRSQQTLVIFDEVEDVFPVQHLGSAERSIPKAEMNRVLETNPVPAFWVSNRVGQLNGAYLRRFDLIVEVGTPPKSVRKRLLEDALGLHGGHCPVIDQIATARDLTPAVLARAARVVRHAGDRGSDSVDRLELALKGYREVTNSGEDSGALALPQYYDLGLVNASEPLAAVSASLARHRQGRVLLHGPPGTGKTAFANFVAQQLDRPILQKRASDILSPWLGQSEHGARRMFDEAKDEEAVLFLDEADSLLRDRQGALGRWEGPVVNEILTGMERFRGVFICATNLLEALDPASLRRFTFKIGFDWLTEHQRWRLLLESFAGMANVAPADELQRARIALSRLDALAPGDFAVVVERAQLGMEFATLARVVEALAEECRHKAGGRRGIGF